MFRLRKLVEHLAFFFSVPLLTATLATGQVDKSTANIQTSAIAITDSPKLPTAMPSGSEPKDRVRVSASSDPLIKLLMSKGILTAPEVAVIEAGGTSFEQRDRLAALLRDKGVISQSEFAGLHVSVSLETSTVDMNSRPERPRGTELTSQDLPPAPRPSNVIPAFAPVGLLPIDTPRREGLIPDIKLGSGARLKLYGLFKTSLIHNSSSPQGNDFPLPLLAGDTGPTQSPEFHIRARGLRLGANFEWIDPAPKIVLTGKLEFDFEGDFTRVNNRSISSIRSSQPSLRLAWVRIDRRLAENATGFLEFGLDWTPFVSSTLPPTIENTFFGGAGYGAAFERAPQARFGFNFNAGGTRAWKFQPEFAIVLPAFGDTPANVADQLGFGERQGADSSQPSIQGRFVTEFRLDRAEGVAPAEFIVSFEHAKRRAIVTAANVPAAFRTAFPAGADVESTSNGLSAELQLPTRFVTVMSKYYAGSDLRFYFAGQLLSTFNDTTGLTGIASTTSIDGASTVVFGLRNGVPAVAAQRPVRAVGGFVSLGFPLSRIFKADPKGRNAGWTAVLHYGFDEAFARDARRFSPVRGKSDLFLGNLQYKLNSYVTFAFEEGLYRTRSANNSVFDFGGLPLLRGIPSRTAHNVRSEFAMIFSF